MKTKNYIFAREITASVVDDGVLSIEARGHELGRVKFELTDVSDEHELPAGSVFSASTDDNDLHEIFKEEEKFSISKLEYSDMMLYFCQVAEGSEDA